MDNLFLFRLRTVRRMAVGSPPWFFFECSSKALKGLAKRANYFDSKLFKVLQSFERTEKNGGQCKPDTFEWCVSQRFSIRRTCPTNTGPKKGAKFQALESMASTKRIFYEGSSKAFEITSFFIGIPVAQLTTIIW